MGGARRTGKGSECHKKGREGEEKGRLSNSEKERGLSHGFKAYDVLFFPYIRTFYFRELLKKNVFQVKPAPSLMNFSNKPCEMRPVYEGASSVYRSRRLFSKSLRLSRCSFMILLFKEKSCALL